MCTCGLEQVLAKGQIVNIFSSEGHMVSVGATHLPLKLRAAIEDNINQCGCGCVPV